MSRVKTHLASVWSRLKERFNPRLHPLLALAIGLGLFALLGAGAGQGEESHTEGHILERLLAAQLDPEHGPLFWLREVRNESDLARQAREVCSTVDPRQHPNCQLLATLDRAVETLEIPPEEPPQAEGDAAPEETSP